MGVSDNSGTPKSSILIGFPLFSPSILGYPYFWKHPYIMIYIYIYYVLLYYIFGEHLELLLKALLCHTALKGEGKQWYPLLKGTLAVFFLPF